MSEESKLYHYVFEHENVDVLQKMVITGPEIIGDTIGIKLAWWL